jgi:hypothetical protein
MIGEILKQELQAHALFDVPANLRTSLAPLSFRPMRSSVAPEIGRANDVIPSINSTCCRAAASNPIRFKPTLRRWHATSVTEDLAPNYLHFLPSSVPPWMANRAPRSSFGPAGRPLGTPAMDIGTVTSDDKPVDSARASGMVAPSAPVGEMIFTLLRQIMLLP